MDKTSTIRRATFQVLLGILTIQALTPDALDLALIAHYRPPGPVIVLMSFFADEDDGAMSPLTTRSPRSPSPRVASTDQSNSSDDEPADNIWQPLWPELALARSLQVHAPALPRSQTISYDLINARDDGWVGRSGGTAVSGRDLSCSLCRIIC